jgi:hypothetical protein
MSGPNSRRTAEIDMDALPHAGLAARQKATAGHRSHHRTVGWQSTTLGLGKDGFIDFLNRCLVFYQLTWRNQRGYQSSL